MAELDQSSFAYLKGNINFAIYSLKLVAVAPRWSGKVPSGFIILMVKEGMVVNALGELRVSRAPLEEAPSPSWMWLGLDVDGVDGPAQAHMPGGWVEPVHTGSQLKKEMSACRCLGVGVLKLMSIESVMQPSHPSHPLLLLPQFFPASGSFTMSQFLASGGQSIGA